MTKIHATKRTELTGRRWNRYVKLYREKLTIESLHRAFRDAILSQGHPRSTATAGSWGSVKAQ